MKRTLLLLTAIMMVATLASANLDPSANDQIGMYFDTNADVVCTTANFIDHVPAYFILTNPTMTSTRGFELGLDVIGRTNTSVTVTYPVNATDVGAAGTGGHTYNYIVGYANPMLTQPATVLATLDIFYLDQNPLDFIITPAAPSSDPAGLVPMLMLEDFSLVPANTSNEPGLPAAQINGACIVVDNEDASFGAVKALFR